MNTLLDVAATDEAQFRSLAVQKSSEASLFGENTTPADISHWITTSLNAQHQSLSVFHKVSLVHRFT